MVRMITHNLSTNVSQNPRIRAATEICRTLHDENFSAWWVGGCVRDFLFEPDSVPSDIDIATSASLSDMRKLFPDIIAIGRAFGVGLLRCGDFTFEVATFRKESDYADRRHPSQVGPGTMEEDSQRRDFTINALYFDPLTHTIADFHGGLEDIQQKILRCVGDAGLRLQEDPLRIFRLFRFAANLKLEIDKSTLDAALAYVSELKFISKERFLLEISKLKPHSVEKFSLLATSALTELMGIPAPKQRSIDSKFHPPMDAFRFPGTLLALMCLRQCHPLDENWAAALSRWPLTLEDKAHIELISKVSQAQFYISHSQEKCCFFLEQMKWLFKQSRIRASDVNWIVKATPAHQGPELDFLGFLLELISHSDPDLTLSQALERATSARAKPLRKELQLWANEKSPEALGWARLIVDVIILMDLTGVSSELRPSPLREAASGKLSAICELAESLAKMKTKRRK